MSSNTLQLPTRAARSTPLPKVKVEPQSTPRLSSLHYIKNESPSTPLSEPTIEVSQAPTPKIKVEPQSTPKASSHPRAPTNLPAKRTLRASRMRPPKRPAPFHPRTRAALRTPRDLRHRPAPSYNLVRYMMRRAEIELGITPCPGEMGVPNGAVRRVDRGVERFCFHMNRKWWGKRLGHLIEDGEESEEEEMEVADDGAGEMVDMLMHDARKHNSLVQIALEALEMVSEAELADKELEESDDEWEEPDNELYRALSARL